MPSPLTIADLIDDEAQDGSTDEDKESEDDDRGEDVSFGWGVRTSNSVCQFKCLHC